MGCSPAKVRVHVEEIELSDYQRARSPEQKAERMEAIMDAAEGLFAQLPYHEINMGLIAKELGWSRSNLYKYASTQEEVFLALHSRANRAYVDDLVANLKNAPLSSETFAKRWAAVTNDHPEFLRYQDILIAIIESNASLDRLVEFKCAYAEMTEPLFEIIQKQTECDTAGALDFYLRLIYQAPGLYNHFHCAERTAEAMRIAGMPPIRGSFEKAYSDFVLMCLNAQE